MEIKRYESRIRIVITFIFLNVKGLNELKCQCTNIIISGDLISHFSISKIRGTEKGQNNKDAGIMKRLKLESHHTYVGVGIYIYVQSFAHAFGINSPVLILRRFILCILCFDINFYC